jgi:hypothetical protein
MTMTGGLTRIGWGIVGEPQEGVIVPTPDGPGIDVTGYNEADYWDDHGEFLGPDIHGIVPVYLDEDVNLFPPDAKRYPWIA